MQLFSQEKSEYRNGRALITSLSAEIREANKECDYIRTRTTTPKPYETYLRINPVDDIGI